MYGHLTRAKCSTTNGDSVIKYTQTIINLLSENSSNSSVDKILSFDNMIRAKAKPHEKFACEISKAKQTTATQHHNSKSTTVVSSQGTLLR